MCAGPGSMKISVEPHQIITTRSTWLLVAEAVDVLADRLRASPACSIVSFMLRAVEALHVARVERGRHRPHRRAARRRSARGACRRRARRRARRRRRRRRGTGPTRRTRCRRAPASGTKSLDQRACGASVRLPSRIVPICVSEPIGSPMPRLTSSTPAMSVDRDRAEADGEHAEAAVGRLHHRRLDDRTFSGRHARERRRALRTTCCTTAPDSSRTRRPRASPHPLCARRLDPRVKRASTMTCRRATRRPMPMRTE